MRTVGYIIKQKKAKATKTSKSKETNKKEDKENKKEDKENKKEDK